MSYKSEHELPDISAIDLAAVERAMKRLPFLEREALLLKSRDNLTYAEIGAVLGLSPMRAQAKVASGLVRLHRSLTRPKRSWWPHWCARGKADK